MKKIQKIVDKLNEKYTRVNLLFGYVGNVERWGDDRTWYVFAEFLNFNDKKKIKIGGYSTSKMKDFSQYVERNLEKIILWHMYQSDTLMKAMSR
jgi:hypothetical protein